MFETAVVRARIGDRQFAFLSLSLAVHSVAIAAVIAVSVASVRLPQQAPKQMTPLFLAPPVTLPPALGTVEHRRPRQAAPSGAPPAPAAPAAIPDSIPIETVTASTPASVSGETQGVPSGVPGGIGTEAPAAADAAGPLQVGGDVKSPVVIHRVEPPYPRIALQARMSGSVVLQCVIDKSGHIRDVHVVSSTFAAFEQPTIDAVQQWIFTPGTLHGLPVETIFELTVRFQVR